MPSPDKRTVVITGGAGYIGSHVVLALMAAGYSPVIFDDFSGSSRSVLTRLQHMLGKPVPHVEIDLMDTGRLREVLTRVRPVAVVHLAIPPAIRITNGVPDRKAHGRALDDQVWMGFSLIQAMEAVGCRTLVAASSAVVYAEDAEQPLRENAAKAWTRLPGNAFLALEDLYFDHQGRPEWRVGVLRLFDVVGAHSSQWLGPPMLRSSPDWLMELAHAAAGSSPHVCIRGRKLPTSDGTPVRDYVHVEDASKAFAKALDALDLYGESFAVNIASGRAVSLIEALLRFEKVSARSIKTLYGDAIPDTPAASVADVRLAGELLGWQAQHSLTSMCAHTWGWYESYMQRRLPV